MKKIGVAVLGLSACVLSAWSQQLTNRVPTWSQNSVGLASNIIAYYSSALRGTTVTTNTFFLDGAMSGRKNGAITFNAATNQVTLDPLANLRPGEWLSAHLTRGILSSGGAETTPFQWAWHNAASGIVGKTQIYFKRYNISGNFGICTDVELGDINGDGYLDTVGDWYSFRWFCLNDGTGGFYPGHEYSVSDRQGRCNRLGDLDGDGDLDLVDLNINGSDVGVCINNGSLPFDFTESVYTYTNSFDDLCLADVNGDGSLDLWVGADRTSRIYTNNGSAHFTLSQTIADGATNGMAGILTDLNGDGSVDAWRLSPVDSNTRLWTNNGAGVFSAAGDFVCVWSECRPGDFNNDGKVDVAYANGIYVNIVTNDGHGAFSPFFSTSFAANGPILFELGDMDGDGDLDLAGIQHDANNAWLRVMLNRGTFFSLAETNSCGYDGRLGDLDIGDVDGDGTLDVVVSCIQTRSAVFLNTYPAWSVLGTNGLAMMPAAAPSVASGTELGVVPIGKAITNTFTLNNQTVVDFVFSTALTDTNGGPGGASFFYTQPTSTYYTTRQSSSATTFSIVYTPINEGDHWARVRLTDNGTNMFDMFLHATCSGFIVTNTQPKNGTPDTAPGGNITAQFSSTLMGSSVTSNRFITLGSQSGLHRGSFSFNTTSNQVTLNPSSDFRCGETVFAILTDEITTSSGHSMIPYTWSFRVAVNNSSCAALFADLGQRPGTNDARSAALGDLNGDGLLDLFVANYAYGSEVWMNNGTGTLANSGQRIGTNLNATGVALGDLDHDGDLDAILASWQQSNTVWMNNGSGTFTVSQTLQFTSKGRKVVLADFDGDTYQDAFILNDGETNIVWQNSSGTFGAILSRPGCHAGRDAAAGDLNGDGKTDLLIVNADSSSDVWTNNGAGVFTLATNVHPEGGISAALGDLDYDGDLDIVIGCTNGPTIAYRNDGHGGFGTTFANTITGYCGAVQLGCLNSDADLDLMRLRDDGGASSVWLNGGGGTFGEETVQGLGVIPTPRSVEFGDLDNDGDLDAVLVLGTNGVRVLVNTRAAMQMLSTNGTTIASAETPSIDKGTDFGTLTGGSLTNWFLITNTTPVNMVVQNITTSGVMASQFRVIQSPSGVTAYSSASFGVVFQPQASGTQAVTFAISGSWTGGTFQLSIRGNFIPSFHATNTVPQNAERAVACNSSLTVHFNHPVNPDTVTTNTFRLWSVFRGSLAGTVTVDESKLFATFTPATNFLPGETIFAELNDGVRSEDNSCSLPARLWSFITAVPKGSGLFTASALNPWSASVMPSDIALGDLDNDGDLDGAVAMDSLTSSIVRILLNDGAAHFTTNGQSFPYNYTDTEGVALGDLDDDGDLDIVVGQYSSYPQVLRNNGSAQFTMQTNVFPRYGMAWPAVGDLDGDGDLDVLFGTEDGDTKIWFNDGSGQFTLSGQNLGQALVNPQLADLDGDGDLDVVEYANHSSETGYLYMLVNNGQGIFSTGQILSFAITARLNTACQITLGDLDADGDMDIAYRGMDSACKAWLNSGSASFTETSIPYPANSYGFAMGDLDADQDLDFLIGTTTFSAPYPVLNDGSASFSFGTVSSNVSGVGLFAFGDLDGNGTLDALNSGSDSYAPSVLLNLSLPGMLLIGTNGAAIASGDAADPAKGTAFCSVRTGRAVTNWFSVTNNGTATMNISGWTTNGPGAAQFGISGLPSQLLSRTKANFTIVFAPGAADSYSASLEIENDTLTTPYIVNLSGVVCQLSTNIGPSAGGTTLLVTNGAALGNGADITNVTVCGVAASIVAQGATWVEVVLGVGPTDGATGAIVIQSETLGATTIAGAYTYNPAGTILGAGVSPASGSVDGGYQVVIRGSNLCDGADITNVTLCGVSAASIASQSATQVVIVAGAAGAVGLGDVRVFSTSFGETVKSNGFEYTSSATQLELSSTNANVREAGEGRFFVRLDSAPTADMTAVVARVSGSTNIVIMSGAELVFTPAAWTNWLTVTLGAGADADAANGTATFEVTMPGAATQTVVATELDIDLGANLALASGGSAIAGAGTVRPGDLTDGIHTSKANYGYMVWTIVPPKTMTLDLKVQTALSRIRLLNWDWQLRDQFYTIESSPDNATWTTVADASTGLHRGWDDWGVSSTGRYLRFTGLSNSVKDRVYVAEWEVYGGRPAPVLNTNAVNVRENGEGRFFVKLDQAPAVNTTVDVARASGDTNVTVKSGARLIFKPSNWATWQTVTLGASDDADTSGGTAAFSVAVRGLAAQTMTAAEMDDDIGTNLALSSRGSTIAGGSRRTQLIDGIYTSSANYGYTIWTSAPPQAMILDLKTNANLSRVRVLNWDWDTRTHRYTVEGSTNGTAWTMLADASTGTHSGWEDWAVAGVARYLRFTGLYNSTHERVCITEWEVYGKIMGKKGGRGVVPWLAKAAAASGGETAGESGRPVTVVTSDDGPDHTNGWGAVDGDTNTLWAGRPGAGGWYIAVGYDATRMLTNLALDLAEGSLTNIQFLYSLDALNWAELPKDLGFQPIPLNYLWLVFPADPVSGTAPGVIEIHPQP